jgi:hypothetical protein
MLKIVFSVEHQNITTVTQHITDGSTAIDGINIWFALRNKKRQKREGVRAIRNDITGMSE